MNRHIPFAAEEHLDWLALADAIADGHRRPKAQLDDIFLSRGENTVLNRAAWIEGLGIAVKTATIFPGNIDFPAVNGAVSLLSDRDGTLEATIDFHLVTKWKTAADSLLAARRLAPPKVQRILIVGAGTVAHSLRDAYGAAFPDARFSIWNRKPDRAESLASRYPGTDIAGDLAEAVNAADIVTSATMSQTPLLRGDWLRPGQHIDLIGAFRDNMREADDAALKRARIFVDSRETVAHIGEIRDPLSRGVLTDADIVADFYALEAFTRAPEDITLFKNGGGAHLDLMTARYILGAAGAP